MAHNKQSKDMQDNVIKAIRTVVEAELRTLNATKSTIGVVVEDPKNYKAKVKINDDIYEAIVPEHAHHWIQKDDVVIIKDLYNDKKKLVIDGKTGHTSGEAQLVFSDSRDPNKYVSGVDGIFDEDGNLLNYATIDSEGFGPGKPGEPGGENPDEPGEPTYPTGPPEIIFDFIIASSEWNINHNFHKSYPNVILVDSNNELFHGTITYVDANSIKITFNRPVTGKAILS